MRVMSGLALAVLVSACGGGDDFEPPVCAPGELAVEGTVDGEAVSIRVASAGHVWSNIPSESDNAYLEVYGAGREPILRIEWDRTVARGQTTDAFGYVNLPSGSGSLHVGNCADDGFASLVTSRAEGADFLLRDLRAGPPCEGEAVGGELAGCLTFSSN